MSEYIVNEIGYPGAVKQEVVGELVRCKDCIKYAEVMEGTSPKCMRAFWLGGDMSPEDFCSRGVRKATR